MLYTIKHPLNATSPLPRHATFKSWHYLATFLQKYDFLKLAAQWHCQPGMSCRSEDIVCTYHQIQPSRYLCSATDGLILVNTLCRCSTGSFKSPFAGSDILLKIRLFENGCSLTVSRLQMSVDPALTRDDFLMFPAD